MLIEEFEKRTGIFPTMDLYRAIEARYNATDMDKDEFCKLYKKNADGMAEAIAYDASMEAIKKEREMHVEIEKKDEQIDALKKQIEDLKQQLDRAQGWEPYEVSAMSQDRYNELAKEEVGTEFLNQEEAAQRIAEEFGFAYRKIKVYETLPKYQKSRDGCIRKRGTVDRRPVYNATDWNYIRFDVAGRQYEAVNGQLYQYND